MQSNGSVVICPLVLGIGTQNAVTTTIEYVEYQKENEENSSMLIGFRQNGQLIQSTKETPSRFIIADEDGMHEIPMNDSVGSNIGVLIDTVHNRVLLADPTLLDSTFTQLFYLEGRYNEHFDLFDDRTTFSGSRILTWRVDWDGDE